MKSAGFLLDTLFFPEIEVRANIKYFSGSAEPRSEPKLGIFFNHKERNKYQMALTCKLEAGEADPYSLDFMVIGIFSVDEDVPESEREKKIALSGPNILYGALRDQIATLTSVSVWPQYFLPPVVFGPEDFNQPTHDN